MRNGTTLRSFLKNRWRSLALGSVFLLITNMLHVFLPSFVGRAIDLLHRDFVLSQLYYICIIILIIEFVKGVTRFFMRYIIIGTSWRVENDIRRKVFDHLLKLPITYYNRTRTGDIIARITNDLNAVRIMLGPGIMYTMNVAVLVPMALVFMLSQDVALTFYAILPFPFVVILIYSVGRRIHRSFVKVQESYSDISAHTQEDLNAIQVIKAFVREENELTTLRKLSRGYLENNKKIIQLQSLMFPLMDMFVSAGVIILLWVGGRKIVAGKTTIGTVVAMIMYIDMLVWPSIALGWVIAVFQRGSASMNRIGEIFNESIEPQASDDVSQTLKGEITVRNLSFSYNEDDRVLSGISFSIKPGTTTALVGRTGSGKSTLLEILAGFYPVQPGSVSYDGIDITEIPLSRLRASLAYVPQETFLFSETIAENISFGREDSDRAAIRNAADQAFIADEIEQFPHGFETVLGERGITVSGGQRQRIAIARALISVAPIVFFDDSLSNVDTFTEKQILKNLHAITADKTTLIVTQRLGAIKDADEILYMKDGHIIERGRHETLMKLDGEYAGLFREQESIESLDAL